MADSRWSHIPDKPERDDQSIDELYATLLEVTSSILTHFGITSPKARGLVTAGGETLGMERASILWPT